MSNGTPWSVTGSAGFYLEFFRFVAHRGLPNPARYLVSANGGFRREVLSQARYPEHSNSEDMVFSSHLISQGRTLLFLPRASIRHQNRTGFRTVLSHQRKLGGGAYLYRLLDSPKRAVERIVRGEQRRGVVPPLWDGHAAERVVDAIEAFLKERGKTALS